MRLKSLTGIFQGFLLKSSFISFFNFKIQELLVLKEATPLSHCFRFAVSSKSKQWRSWVKTWAGAFSIIFGHIYWR